MHHRLPAVAALTTSYYAAPQEPDDARHLFEAACASAALHQELPLPLRPNRAYAAALVLAREWGLTGLDERVAAAVEASYQPTWDHGRGEFTWGMGLAEEHPRGQFNAYLAAAEAAGPGAWARLSAAPLDGGPQVVGVDFPEVALSRAEWIGETLHLALAPRQERADLRTTFRIVGASTAPGWTVRGPDGSAIERESGELVLTAPMISSALEIRPSSG